MKQILIHVQVMENMKQISGKVDYFVVETLFSSFMYSIYGLCFCSGTRT